jgi:protein-tyrosine phosphatase
VTGRPTWRFGRIAPQIILGGQPARRILPILARAGVTGVVNLRKEFDYERDIGGAKLRYLYLPTVDNEAPSLEHLALGVNFIKEEVTKGGSVYIHCWEGLGRGPTMTAAYLVSTGLSPQAAWERIRSIRPFIRPNKLQTEQLERFAAQYAQHGEAPAPVEQAAEVKTLAQSQKDMPEPLHKSPQSDHGQ